MDILTVILIVLTPVWLYSFYHAYLKDGLIKRKRKQALDKGLFDGVDLLSKGTLIRCKKIVIELNKVKNVKESENLYYFLEVLDRYSIFSESFLRGVPKRNFHLDFQDDKEKMLYKYEKKYLAEGNDSGSEKFIKRNKIVVHEIMMYQSTINDIYNNMDLFSKSIEFKKEIVGKITEILKEAYEVVKLYDETMMVSKNKELSQQLISALNVIESNFGLDKEVSSKIDTKKQMEILRDKIKNI